MAHYIDKDALVAEIERRIKSCAKQREDMLNVQCHTLADDASARMGELNCIQDFIDTLEVKEVDLEKEIKEVQRNYKTIEEYEGYPCTMYANDIERIAKHFFELGLKVGGEKKQW